MSRQCIPPKYFHYKLKPYLCPTCRICPIPDSHQCVPCPVMFNLNIATKGRKYFHYWLTASPKKDLGDD